MMTVLLTICMVSRGNRLELGSDNDPFTTLD
jgi:hypothetical protein